MTSKVQRAQYATPTHPKGQKTPPRRPVRVPAEQEQGPAEKVELISRDAYKPPPELRRLDPLRPNRQYFVDLQTTFTGLCHDLLRQPTLPYNPYPRLIWSLRQISEKFHLYQQKEADIISHLAHPVEETAVPHLYRSKGDPRVYGARSLVQLVAPGGLEQYHWLVENVTPVLADLPTLPEHSIQVMMALIGPAVFSGTFYKQPQRVHLRQEYLVTGTDLTQAVDLFVNSVVQDLNKMEKKKNHKVIGMHVPTQNTTKEEAKDNTKDTGAVTMDTPWTDVLWEMDRVHLEKDNFTQSVKEAVLGNQMVTMECVFCLDPSHPVFVYGQKQSTLNFVEVGGHEEEQRLTTFTQYPLATLHEGVFLKKSHAEAYMGMFLPLLLGQAPQQLIVHDKAGSLTLTKRTGKHVTQPAKGGSQPGKKSTLVSVKKFFGDKAAKSKKVQLDGFRFEELKAQGPFASQITGPIRSVWQERMCQLTPESDLFECLHLMILLTLMDGHRPDNPLFVELARASGSTAGHFYALIEEIRVMSACVGSLYTEGEGRSIHRPLVVYIQKIQDLFENKLRECSSDEVTITHVIAARITTLLELPEEKLNGSPAHARQVEVGLLYENDELCGGVHVLEMASTLQDVGQLCQTLFTSLAEAILLLSPHIQKYIKDVKKIIAAEKVIPEPEEKRKSKKKQVKGSKQKTSDPTPDPAGEEVIVHGMEEGHLRKHDEWVVRVSECAEVDPSPKAINTEAVLIKYMLDVHLDEVWQDFLVELFSRDVLPPNPYPRLVSCLRRAALKMDLWFEEEEMLKERVFNGVSKPTEDFKYVHVIPGCGAHGSAGLLSVLSTEGYFTITDLAQDFVPKFYIQMKGLFRVALCTAVTGQSALYGRLVPHLSTLELDEHIYIKGPEGCSREAVQLCSNIVHDEIMALIKKGDHPVCGVYFGTPQNRLTQRDVRVRPRSFHAEFETACHKHQPIFLKAYIMKGWRYYPVIKHYKLHWLTENGSELFYPADPTEFYQSIFFEKERAVFYHQSSQSDSDDPQSYAAVRQACIFLEEKIARGLREEQDFFHVHKLLFRQALVRQESSCLLESWRMFHSLAGQVEYVNVLNTSLQDLVGFALERQTDSNKKGKGNSDGNDPGVENNQPSNQGNKDPDLGPLNLKTLNGMATAFRQKILDVTQSDMTLTSDALPFIILKKLETVLVGSNLLIQEQTISKLEEIRNMMVAISNTVSSDLHEALPLAKETVGGILIGPDVRSRRVLSAKLDRPETFLRRPRAGKGI